MQTYFTPLPSALRHRGLPARADLERLYQRPSNARKRLADFIVLMKPRVMLLAVFTALVGLMVAPAHLEPLIGSIAIVAIAAGAGAAGVLNMWYDADIDAMMARTADGQFLEEQFPAWKRLHLDFSLPAVQWRSSLSCSMSFRRRYSPSRSFSTSSCIRHG